VGGIKVATVLVPPIKCQGIKTKLVPWILENAEMDARGKWIEPFMGSGVIGFNRRSKLALFGDVNPHIIEFYNALKSSRITPGVVREFLEHEGRLLAERGEEHYSALRERFNGERSPLDFLFLSRSCFNGIIRFNQQGRFNVPFCRKPQRFSRAYITKIVNQVESVYHLVQAHDWQFERADYREMIVRAGERDFIYCDPPYFGRHIDYYDSWWEQDEHELFVCLGQTRARFMLSTWDSNRFRRNTSIDRYWKRFRVLTKDHFYHIGGKVENRNPIVEALVINYDPSE
jgi:DNA adenine methylase